MCGTEALRKSSSRKFQHFVFFQGWCSSTHSCVNAGSGCIDDLAFDRRSCNTVMKKGETIIVSERVCGSATNCYACQRMSHCVWLSIETRRICVSKTDHGNFLKASRCLNCCKFSSHSRTT